MDNLQFSQWEPFPKVTTEWKKMSIWVENNNYHHQVIWHTSVSVSLPILLERSLYDSTFMPKSSQTKSCNPIAKQNLKIAAKSVYKIWNLELIHMT